MDLAGESLTHCECRLARQFFYGSFAHPNCQLTQTRNPPLPSAKVGRRTDFGFEIYKGERWVESDSEFAEFFFDLRVILFFAN